MMVLKTALPMNYSMVAFLKISLFWRFIRWNYANILDLRSPKKSTAIKLNIPRFQPAKNIELTETFNEFKTQSGESVFVGNNNRSDIACTDGFQNGSKSFLVEVEPGGNLGNEFG